MTRILFSLFILSLISCEGKNDADSLEVQSKISNKDNLNVYIENTQRFMKARDFNQALFNINNALNTITNKTGEDSTYMDLIVFKSEVYSWFQRLDEAERTILNETGLSNEDVELVIRSIDQSLDEDLNKLAEKINRDPITQTKIGRQIALSFIYSVLKNCFIFQEEEQLLFDRPGMNDLIIRASIALLKVRNSRIIAHGYVRRIKKAMLTEGETRRNQKYLSHYLYETGKFKEASEIADKYLTLNNVDVDFLFVKMNIAMALGNVETMEDYEESIKAINPKLLRD